MNTSDSQPDNPQSVAQSAAASFDQPPLPVGQDTDPAADALDFAVVAVPEPAALTRGFTDALPGQLPEHLQEEDSGVIGAGLADASAADPGFQANGNVAVLRTGSNGTLGRTPIRRPSWRFLMSHPAHWIALGFGSGLPWVMPGTFGTLFGWMAFVACMPHFTDVHWFVSIVVGFAVGIWACGVTGRNLGVSDHGSIVWDEIVAIWLVLWLVPQTVIDQVAAFILFRTIDIVKPQPIRYFDARWKNGFGVMFDDLLAAFFTLLLFAIYYRFAGLPG